EGGLVLGFGQVLGEEEDDRDLHELGRLDAEFPEEPYPGLRAVDLMPEEADVEDEEEEEGIDDRRVVLHPLIVDQGHDDQDREARDGPDDLLEVLVGNVDAFGRQAGRIDREYTDYGKRR